MSRQTFVVLDAIINYDLYINPLSFESRFKWYSVIIFFLRTIFFDRTYFLHYIKTFKHFTGFQNTEPFLSVSRSNLNKDVKVIFWYSSFCEKRNIFKEKKATATVNITSISKNTWKIIETYNWYILIAHIVLSVWC